MFDKNPNGSQLGKRRTSQPKRALDAFSIAQQQIPEALNLRKSRLGDSVPDKAKRRKGDTENEDSKVTNGRRAKRSRLMGKAEHDDNLYEGSDSDGNAWRTGTIATDDDSSLDSDEAWASSDEERFMAFKVANRPKAKRTRVEASLGFRDSLKDEDNEGMGINGDSAHELGSGDESEDFAANAVDLATMLDDASDEGLGVLAVDGKRQLGVNLITPGHENDRQEEGNMSDISISTAEDASQDDKKLDALHSLVLSMNGQGSAAQTQKTEFDAAQEAVTPATHSITSKTKLTVGDLLSTMSDPGLRSSLKIMANRSRKSYTSKGIPRKLSIPLPKRQQDRIDRAAALKKSKETLDRWVDTVKHNRRAEHITFPLLDQEAEAVKGSRRMLPITSSRRVTDLESTIHNLLVESGLADHQKNTDQKIQEFEELAAKAIPAEEIKARRAELRRSRELLFREEVRAKRIKKIKSKAYRKVHRKERERNLLRDKEALAASGAVDSDDEQERLDRQRAEERMGRRHRENRWTKSLKSTGRAAWDEDAREGVNEMFRRDEELRRRIQGRNIKRDDSVGSGSESTEEVESEGEDSFAARMRSKLEQLEKSDNRPQTRLSSLRFMQRAEATQKAQNDEALRQLTSELNGKDSENGSSDGPQEEGRRSYGSQKTIFRSAEPAVGRISNDFEEPQGSDHEVDVSRHGDDAADGVEPEIIVDQYTPKVTKPRKTTIDQRLASASAAPKSKMEELINPWSTMSKTASKSKPMGKDLPIDLTILQQLKHTRAPNTPIPQDKRIAQETGSDAEPDADDFFSGFSPPQSLHPLIDQQSLIRQAFAGDDAIAEETFNAEKAALAAEEEPFKPVSDILPGWGTWVGLGLSKKEKREAKRAPTANGASSANGKLAKTSEGVPIDRRRDRKLQKVIISEKRLPKTAKFLASELPHPFENRAQYERSLRLPMGPEFTTKETFQGMTKPRVLLRPGVIAPMRKPLV